MSKKDPTMFFDVYYDKGFDWYTSHFDHYEGEKIVGDESPGYIKSIHAPKRIADHLTNPKIMFCFRNPVKRAFSQWWHGYSRGWHHVQFETGIKNHEFFDYWVNPGFYETHLNRWERYFDQDQLYLGLFDDFIEDNQKFIQDIYNFLDIDDTFVPSIVGEKINEANKKQPDLMIKAPRAVRKFIRRTVPEKIINKIMDPFYFRFRKYYNTLEDVFASRSKYEDGIKPDTQRRLEKLYADGVRGLEMRTGRNLDHWFEYVEL
jgi:hypothetical protein